MKKIVLFLLLMVASQMGWAQHTIESIRKTYADVKESIAMMSDNFPSEGIPAEYYHLRVAQNLRATGPHTEDIRMYFNEVEQDEDEDWNPYPFHWLRLATAKYNFAVRQYYEEYLYDDKGQVMFIYAITPEIGDDMIPYELRMWFDGKRLLRFTAKKAEVTIPFDYDNLSAFKYKEEYSGTTIPGQYSSETDRLKDRAQHLLKMFEGIDRNKYI